MAVKEEKKKQTNRTNRVQEAEGSQRSGQRKNSKSCSPFVSSGTPSVGGGGEERVKKSAFCEEEFHCQEKETERERESASCLGCCFW